MNKLTMAHEYAMKHVQEGFDINYDVLVVEAWKYADAMQTEADKRVNMERPDVLKASNSMELEWQPDWNKAPEWAKYFAMDEDGEFYYFEESPYMAGCSWQPQPHGELGETFDHGYKGNWQDSLRKRPQ